jgi:hypothetical protein
MIKSLKTDKINGVADIEIHMDEQEYSSVSQLHDR